MRNLSKAILGRDHRQNRLIEAPADDLHLTPCHQRLQPLDVLGMVLREPFHQATGCVQGNGNLRIVAEELEEWLIAIGERRFEDTVEVSDRLVIVQSQYKANTMHGSPQMSILLEPRSEALSPKRRFER